MNQVGEERVNRQRSSASADGLCFCTPSNSSDSLASPPTPPPQNFPPKKITFPVDTLPQIAYTTPNHNISFGCKARLLRQAGLAFLFKPTHQNPPHPSQPASSINPPLSPPQPQKNPSPSFKNSPKSRHLTPTPKKSPTQH